MRGMLGGFFIRHYIVAVAVDMAMVDYYVIAVGYK